MKLNVHLLSLLAISLLYNCSPNESVELSQENYFKVSEYSVNLTASSRIVEEEPCFTVDLMAGQHINIGSVSISQTDSDLILTFSTIIDWTIGVTHVSIGDCDEEWVPLTGSGNPKIGRFGHTEPHSQNINKVVYQISLDALPNDKDYYCFAAHAEVEGPNGEETAWAGGDGDDADDGDDNGGGIPSRMINPSLTSDYTVKDFEGRSWATYIEALKAACDDN